MDKKRSLARPYSSENICQNSQNYNSISQQSSDLTQQEEQVLRKIIDHALNFNAKQNASDLNLLDVLNSFDELICHGISVTSSCLTTLNQDLQFDFSGSFGAGKHESQRRASSRTSSLIKGSIAPSVTKIPRPPPSLLNSQFQSCSGQGYILQVDHSIPTNQSIDQPIFNNCQMSMFEQETNRNFDSYREICYGSSNMSTLQQPSQESRPDSSRIKLPKLSFNDLGQNTKSQPQRNWSANQRQEQEYIKEELNEENSELNQTELLKSAELTVFDGAMQSQMQDDSSLMRYSHRQSSIYEPTSINFKNRNDSRNQKLIDSEEDFGSNVPVKFPKLKLVTESEGNQQTSMSNTQTYPSEENKFELENNYRIVANEYIVSLDKIDLLTSISNNERDSFKRHNEIQEPQIIKNSSYQRNTSKSKNKIKKQHAIDSNINIAVGFHKRKMQMKAMKSWLIVKIHKIHAKHLKRLANNYLLQKRKNKAFLNWKTFVKVIAPDIKNNTIAKSFHKRNTLKNVFQQMRGKLLKKRIIREKFVSTQMVLRSSKLRNIFHSLRLQSLINKEKRKKQLFAQHIYQQKYYQKVFYSLRQFVQLRRLENKQIIRTRIFAKQTLKRKGFQSLKRNIILNSMNRKKNQKARNFYRNRYTTLIKAKSFRVLQLYSQFQKQRTMARQNRCYWLQKRFFKLLKINYVLRSGLKTQLKFVRKYRTSALLVKYFKAFQKYMIQEKERLDMVVTYLERLKKRKLFRIIQKYARKNRVLEAPFHGPYLMACEIMLKSSFEQLMNNVWKDFPKQKMVKNPQTGKKLVMLNYIGLSKNLKKRELFFEANQNLQLFMQFKVFYGWLTHIRAVSNLRKKREQEILVRVFKEFNRLTITESIQKAIVNNKTKKRNLTIKVKIFKQLKKYGKQEKKMKRGINLVRRMRKRNMLMNFMMIWRKKYLKQVDMKQKDKFSEQIYKDRTKSKYLAIWMKKLHKILKVKHLNTVKVKFQKQIFRKRFFIQWRTIAEKFSYLEEQDKAIITHQTNLLLYNCFKALRIHSENSIQIRKSKIAADQEYQYWLGKRVMVYLKQGLKNIKNQQQLYKFLADDRNLKVTERIFSSLKLFSDFKRQRKLNDQLMTLNIHTMKKKVIFGYWQKKVNRNLGLQMVHHSFIQIQKRVSFEQIKHIQAFQESVVEVMRNKQPSYLLLQCFNILKKKNKQTKQNHLKTMIQQENSQNHLLRNSFNEWIQLYLERRRVYMTYAFTVIQIKQKLQENIFSDWKSFTRYSLMKKQSYKYREKKIKRTMFKTMKLDYLKGQQKNAAYDYIKQTKIKNSKLSVLSLWKQKYQKKISLKKRFNQKQLEKVGKIFQAFLTNKQTRLLIRKIRNNKQEFINAIIKKSEFKRYRKLLRNQKQGKQLYKIAQNFNKSFMFKAAINTWLNFYKTEKQMISCQLKMLKKNKQFKKREYLRIWVERCMKRIRKIRAINALKNIRNKKLVIKRFISWAENTQFLISLEQRVDSFIQNKHTEQKKSSLQHLIINKQNKKLNKKRMRDIKKFSDKKIKLKVLSKMKAYNNKRQSINLLNAQVNKHYENNLKLRYLEIFRKQVKQTIAINKASKKMSKFQIIQTGPMVFTKLKQNKREQRKIKLLRNHSDSFRVNSLTAKAFKILLLFALKQSDMKLKIGKAYQSYGLRILSKALHSMKTHFINQQILHKKRFFLRNIINHVDQENSKQRVLIALYQNQRMNQERVQQLRAYLQQLKMRRLFSVLTFFKLLKKGARYQFHTLSTSFHNNLKRQYLQQWIHAFKQSYVCNSHIQLKQLNKKLTIFNIIKGNYIKNQKFYFIQRQKSIKLKALSLTALLSYRNYREHSAFLTIKSNRFHCQKLAIKVFQSLNLYKLTSQKMRLCSQNRNFSLAKLVFESYKLLRMRKQQILELRIQREQRAFSEILNFWIQKYNARMEGKNKLKMLFARSEFSNQRELFEIWKKGTFFMRMCELLYTYGMKEQQEMLLQNCFREWRRLKKHQENKEDQYESLHSNHQYHLAKQVLAKWRQNMNVKGRVLEMKIARIVEPVYINAMENIYQYGIQDQYLREKFMKFQNKRMKKMKQKYLFQWMKAYEKREQAFLLEENRSRILMKKVFRGLEEFKLKHMEQKYQMLRIIQFFSERRSELLLQVSKTFLILNSEYSEMYGDNDSAKRICSTALAKYVIEKWKNVKDVLSVENHMKMQACQFNSYGIQKKFFTKWREQFIVRQSKQQLRQSVIISLLISFKQCYEFYAVQLLKKGLKGLCLNQVIKDNSKYLQSIQHEFLRRKQEYFQFIGIIRCKQMFEQYFIEWYKAYRRSAHLRSANETIQAHKNYQLLSKAFMILNCYRVERQRHQIMNHEVKQQIAEKKNYLLISKYFSSMLEYVDQSKKKRILQGSKLKKAYSFYYFNLKNKIFKQLKNEIEELKLKGRYSRLYTVLTAWKFFVKEKVILRKYLDECNYQGNADKKSVKSNLNMNSIMNNKQSQGQDSNSHKRAFSQMKENIGDNFGDFEQNMLKQHRQMSRQQAINNDKLTSSIFTPTLGEPLNIQNMNSVNPSKILAVNMNTINSKKEKESPINNFGMQGSIGNSDGLFKLISSSKFNPPKKNRY